ncbi:MAG TPA: carboxypeptidase-like regulatory domain-containing protein, partial [Terriglobales bacterium]|nr:carboxypeptidase-like regulatory domain-containing protein [Terriglobales bacterium]
MQKAIRWVGIILLLLGSAVYGFCQATATGTILGNVTDNTKAIVVGAQVVVTSTATGLTRTTTTNDSGNYRFDQMSVGTYTVKVSKGGFATTTITSLELLVGQTATGNITLKPGTATEVIEVTETAPLVDTTKTSVSQAIPPADVEEIPMLGRDVANLAYLAPGVRQTDSYDPTKNRYAILSVNGQGGRNINVTVNGVDNKDSTVGGPVMQLPLEAVEEFVISTQRFSAANGKSEGAAINMVTKSGTNALHGSLYGFFRDQALNHIDKEAEINGSGKSPYSRQQFGGSIGGPIKKDKAFVFFAIERQREHTSLTEDSNALNQLTLAAAIVPEIKPANVIPTPFFETRYNGRMDYKFNDRHSAYLSYSSQD